MPTFDDTEVGTELPGQSFTVQRSDLVRYAGASGDFNVIHWNERVAREVGLPNVIAHGMLTMAMSGRLVTDWVGDPAAVLAYSVRFSNPVVVPDDEEGTLLVVAGTVQEKLADNLVVVSLTATVAALPVLAAARAVVRLP